MKYKIHRNVKFGESHLYSTEDKSYFMAKSGEYKKYLEWVAEGNTAEVVDIDAVPEPTQKELDKKARKGIAKALKGKKNITKDEQAAINAVVLDMLGV